MKKSIGLTVLCFGFAAVVMTSCQQGAAPMGQGQDKLQWLPQNVQGVFFLDVKKVMTTESIREEMAKNEKGAEYVEFVEKTGIDPQQHIKYASMAVVIGADPKNAEGVVVINMTYAQDKLLAYVKEKKPSIAEKDYNGVKIHAWQEKDKTLGLVMADESNVILGNETVVMTCIDVMQKKKQGIRTNQELNATMGKANQKAMMWGALMRPSDVIANAAENSQMAGIEAIKAVIVSFDYSKKTFMMNMLLDLADASKVDMLAKKLEGFKARGGMFVAQMQQPSLGELLQAIEIKGGASDISISCSITEEMADKLEEAAKASIGGMGMPIPMPK